MGLVAITLINPGGAQLTDSEGYLRLAESLREEGVYWSEFRPGEDLVWPPGYALFVAGIQALFGAGFGAITTAQLALTGLCAWMLVRIGVDLERPRTGYIAAVLLLLSPNLALWSLTVMSEALFTTALVAGSWMLLRYFKAESGGYLLAAGGALGCAGLIRPVAIPLILIWAVMVGLASFRRSGFRMAARAGLGLLAAAAVLLALWAIRNLMVHERFAVSTVGGKTLVSFNLARVVADVEGISRDEAAVGLPVDQPLELALDLFRRHPATFVRVQLVGIGRTLLGSEPGTWSHVLGLEPWPGLGLLGASSDNRAGGLLGRVINMMRDPDYAPQMAMLLYALLYSVFLISLAVLGLLTGRSMTSHERLFILTIGLSVLYLVIIPGAAGQARFRVPAEPGMALIAAYGVENVTARLNQWRLRQLPDKNVGGSDHD
jgi:4-amino-4-deoxy-L-arabinose transferase-like glycosyltransferase